MILRNGILSNLRARGRTLLFTLLLLVLTVTLSLGMGMWAYCARMLADFDESYTSIALLEYMGSDYPDIDAADDFARQAAAALDDEAISAIDGVERWERTDRTLALVEGYERTRGSIPYKDYGVLVASQFSATYEMGWGALPEESLPETRVVDDQMTGSRTYYAPGQEPLELPLVWQQEDGSCFVYVLNEGEVEESSVDLAEMEEPYLLIANQKMVTVGQLPQPYTSKCEYFEYDPITGAYIGYGEILMGYTGIVSQALYSQDGKSSFVAVFEPGDSGFAPQSGERYLLHGKLVDGNSSNRTFAVTDFYEGCDTEPYLLLTGSDDAALTEGIFAEYADFYRAANNYGYLEASDDIAALEVFQQGTLTLAEGRFPQAGEAGACLLSGDTAKLMGVGVGDTISLDTISSQPEDRFSLELDGRTRQLTVVGVTSSLGDYEGWIWVSAAEGGFESPLFGYQLGRVVLDNALARQAVEALEAMAPQQVRVTLYDQGYAAAAQPLETMKSTAVAVTAASACGALAVLFLFAYLFVGRQRETVGILASLGTPKRKIRLWLLSGGAVIAAVAALVGGVTGALTLGRVISAALDASKSLYAADLRYSEAMIGVTRGEIGTAAAPLWPAVAAGCGVFAVALILCVLFLRQAQRQSAPTRGKLSVRVPRGGTSTAGSGAPRFAMLSAKRGGWRSAVVPAAALLLSLLLGMLAAGTQGWDREIDRLYDETVIQGQVVSSNGRSYSSLTVSAQNARTLWQSGMLEDISVSLGWHYWLYEEMPDFSDSSFGEESRAAWIARQPELVALDSLSAAPEFYYVGRPEIQWLDGWDESFLAGSEYYSILRTMVFGRGAKTVGGEETLVYPCLASQSFLDAHGLELGDGMAIMISLDINRNSYDLFIPLTVVGSFVQTGPKANLYVPLSFWCDRTWITGEELPFDQRVIQYPSTEEERDAYVFSATSFQTCRFSLASAVDLESFRDYLVEQNFSQVGKLMRNRTTILLRDQTFTETVGGLGRYISFSRILFPVLLVVVCLLGFVISWLMINGRRMEFAIMRGLGAPRGRVFASFFLEQGALCLLGCAVCCVLLLLLPGGGTARWLAVAGFLACYLAGCALAVLVVGRTKLIDLLSERE